MSETTAATQDSRPQPFLAIGFEDDTLMLVSTAPDRPHGVHLTKLHLQGLCDELTKSSSYRRQPGLVTKMKPISQPVVTWSDMGRTAAYMVCRLGFTDGEEHYLLEVGPLVGTIRPEARSDVFELSTFTGVRIQLERLHIEYGPDGLPTAQLLSDFVKSRGRQPLNVLIGNDDRVMLVMNDMLSRNGLVIVEAFIQGARQYHFDRVTGRQSTPVTTKAREYTEHRVFERSIRASRGVMDCNWPVGDSMYELHAVGYPTSTYIPGTDASPEKLTASNPEWVMLVRDGDDLLIGFKPFTEQD